MHAFRSTAPRRRPTITCGGLAAAALVTAALAPAFGATARAQAQDLTTFTRNGAAALAGGALVLTPADFNLAGSAFRPASFATAGLQSFTATFNYAIGGGSGADGLAFVLQGNGPTALGGFGSGLGYQGIGHSVAALLRTYTFQEVQVGTNGNLDGNAAPSAALRGTNDVTVTYAAGTQLFSVLLNGAPLVSQSGVDLAALVGPQAYVGFTGGTGGSTDAQQINRFSFTTVYGPTATVPEPGTLALAGAGLLAVGAAAARRRRA